MSSTCQSASVARGAASPTGGSAAASAMGKHADHGQRTGADDELAPIERGEFSRSYRLRLLRGEVIGAEPVHVRAAAQAERQLHDGDRALFHALRIDDVQLATPSRRSCWQRP